MKIEKSIFIASFMLQLIAMFALLSNRGPELFEYEEIAVNILKGHGFLSHRLGGVYHSLVPPLYPFLCAVVYFISNYSHLAMLLIQAALTALTCVLVYLIGKEIFNRKTGILSAGLCIVHPGLIIYSVTKLHELSLVAFIFSLMLLVMLKFKRNESYKNSVLVGLLIGACLLTRASIILFIPFFILWMCGGNKAKSIYRCLLKAVLILSVAVVVIAPWLIRNYHVHHKFVFMQTPSVDLWVGNNINATGGNYLKDGRMVLDTMPRDFVNSIYNADELTKDKIFRREVYGFIKNHPFKFIILFFKKLYYFWWFAPYMGIHYSHMYLFVYKIYYSVVLFLALYGVVGTLRLTNGESKEKAFLLFVFFLAISILQSLFYVEGRHRWAVEPLLLVFSAYGAILFSAKLRTLKYAKE